MHRYTLCAPGRSRTGDRRLSYHSIYVFSPSTGDGANPNGGLTKDAQGRLYGTTQYGGAFGFGIVYRLTRPASGQGMWTEEILHSFDGGAGGWYSISPVTFGPDGTLYGTTQFGGLENRGIVFSLQNTPGGTFKVLHSFTFHDGGFPSNRLVFGPDGLLYGTTQAVNVVTDYRNTGTDFSISPLGDTVEYRVLHAFGKPGDGVDPTGLAIVPAGSRNGFLGVTNIGPNNLIFSGDVYSLSISPTGQGSEKPLYTFGPAPDVFDPIDPPVFAIGSLHGTSYGCAAFGGTHGVGGVYQLTPNGNGGVVESVIYNFGDQPNDAEVGGYRQCHLTRGADGNLYGTTDGGGSISAGIQGTGTFFELDPPATAGAQWTLKVIFSFLGTNTFGYWPNSAPLEHAGLFYGTTIANTVYVTAP